MDTSKIRARLAAATPGVWQVRVDRRPGYCAVVETADPWDDATGTRTLASFERDEDAVLFLEAPTDIAALLAALDKAERERNAYRALLVRVSRAWNTDPDDPGFYTEHDAAHEAITAALAAKDCPDAP